MTPSRYFTLSLLILFLWLIIPLGVYHAFDTWSDRGQFGDVFGAVTALFTAFAFLGLLITIHIQAEMLGLQQKELHETRQVLAQQQKAQRALFLATRAQVRVSALQARIEALKIVAGPLNSTARFKYAKNIEEIAALIEKEAAIQDPEEELEA